MALYIAVNNGASRHSGKIELYRELYASYTVASGNALYFAARLESDLHLLQECVSVFSGMYPVSSVQLRSGN